jgi:hypothetical protein
MERRGPREPFGIELGYAKFWRDRDLRIQVLGFGFFSRKTDDVREGIIRGRFRGVGVTDSSESTEIRARRRFRVRPGLQREGR